MMRAILVGAGYFGAELARLATLHGIEITAVVDPHRGADLAAELGATYHADAAQALVPGAADACIVASPNDAHAAPAIAAARAGMHVFCEKPIALTLADCEQMVRAATDAGVVLFAGHVTRFMAGVRRVKDMIDAGDLGRLRYGHAARNGWEDPAAGEVSWKKQRARSGGHLFHHIHELDLLQHLMGTPLTAAMAGGNYAHHGAGHGDEDDLLAATLTFDGALAIAEWGSAMRWPEHYVLVQGERAAARIDLTNSVVDVRAADGSVTSFGLHTSDAEDEERRSSYASTAGGGGVTYGAPADRVPGWLRTIMREELAVFAAACAGRPDPAWASLLDGTAALDSIATAAALTHSLTIDSAPVSIPDFRRNQ